MAMDYSVQTAVKMFGRAFRLVIVVALLMTLSGCLLWESEETTIALHDDGTGTISVRIGPIGSDGADREKKQFDLADFIYGYLKDPALGEPSIENLTHVLTIHGDRLYCDFKGEFKNFTALAFRTDMDITATDIRHPLASDEVVVSTNGTVIDVKSETSADPEGKKYISWPLGSKTFSYRIRHEKGAGALVPGYEPSMSLASLFLDFVKNQDQYKNIYLKYRTEFAESAMADKDYRAAWLNWQNVLQADPGNKKAARALDSLHFALFLNLAEGIPFPDFDITKAYSLGTDSLAKSGYKELQEELVKLAAGTDYLSYDNDLQKVITLLNQKIAKKPSPEDMFLAARLEYRDQPQQAYEKFRQAHEKYPDNYRIFAGYCKTRLTRMPMEAGDVLLEINQYLVRRKDIRDPVELIFAKGTALFMTGKGKSAVQTFITLKSRLFPYRTVGEFLKVYE